MCGLTCNHSLKKHKQFSFAVSACVVLYKWWGKLLESQSKNDTKVCRIVEENLALKDLSCAAAIQPNNRRKKKVWQDSSPEKRRGKSVVGILPTAHRRFRKCCCEEENSANLSKIYWQRLSKTKRRKAHEDFGLPLVNNWNTHYFYNHDGSSQNIRNRNRALVLLTNNRIENYSSSKSSKLCSSSMRMFNALILFYVCFGCSNLLPEEWKQSIPTKVNQI